MPPDEPCIPCGQSSPLRAFSLNEGDLDAFDDGFVPSLVAGVDHAITGGEVVLFDRQRSTSTLLNASAALVWASIDGEASVGSIVDELVAETGADRGVVGRDVRETIARFAHAGITTAPGETRTTVELDLDLEPDDRERRHAERVALVLGRRAWTFERRWRVGGATVLVRTDSDELAALVAPALAGLPAATDAAVTVSITDRGHDAARRFRILFDTVTQGFAPTAVAALDLVLSLLNDVAINRTPGHLVLHAGAVQRDGAVVVVAGPSGRGKSTLTAALVQRGFGYLTDEVAAIDPVSLEVLPYPKAIDLDRSSADLLGIDPSGAVRSSRKVAVAVGRLGEVAVGGAPLRLLVLLEDPRQPLPDAPSPAELLVEILTNTFASTFEHGGPDRPLDALASIAVRVPVLRVARPGIDAACRAVDDRLRSIDGAHPA